MMLAWDTKCRLQARNEGRQGTKREPISHVNLDAANSQSQEGSRMYCSSHRYLSRRQTCIMRVPGRSSPWAACYSTNLWILSAKVDRKWCRRRLDNVVRWDLSIWRLVPSEQTSDRVCVTNIHANLDKVCLGFSFNSPLDGQHRLIGRGRESKQYTILGDGKTGWRKGCLRTRMNDLHNDGGDVTTQ